MKTKDTIVLTEHQLRAVVNVISMMHSIRLDLKLKFHFRLTLV